MKIVPRTLSLICLGLALLPPAAAGKESMLGSELSGALKLIDLSQDTSRQVIVDEVPGQYLGQPNTVLLADNRTIVVAYPEGHGHPNTLVKRSLDGGLTWSDRLPTPDNFTADHYAPTLHRLTDENGVERIHLMVVTPVAKQSFSEDGGITWSSFQHLYTDISGRGNAPPMSIIAIHDSSGRPVPGSYFAMYQVRERDATRDDMFLLQIKTRDGGRTWTRPRRVGNHPDFPGAQPAEPGIIRSPDGKQLLCLVRENARLYPSLFMTSDDEGETWSDLQSLPSALTGDRHNLIYARDGRLVVTFRDLKPQKVFLADGTKDFVQGPFHGDFVAWIGRYEDIIRGDPGQFKVRLIDNKRTPWDTGYSGIELLPDGTVVSTTYGVLEEGEQPLVVSIRYRLAELDALVDQPAGRAGP